MTTSDHGRSPRAGLALAAGGIGVLAAVTAAAQAVAGLIGGVRGTLAGMLMIGAVFAGCWIVHHVRPLLHPVSHHPRAEPQRPGPVRRPAPVRDACEPVKSLT